MKIQSEENTTNKQLWVPERIEEINNPFIYIWIKKDGKDGNIM